MNRKMLKCVAVNFIYSVILYTCMAAVAIGVYIGLNRIVGDYSALIILITIFIVSILHTTFTKCKYR